MLSKDLRCAIQQGSQPMDLIGFLYLVLVLVLKYNYVLGNT